MPGGAADLGAVKIDRAALAGKSKLPAILMSAFAAFGGILFGYDTGSINGIIAMDYWLCQFGSPKPDGPGCRIETSERSLVVSILSAGTFFGALLAYPMSDIFGRKYGLMLSCLVFSVGIILQAASTSIPLYAVGRVIAGLGVGLVSCLVPMYQSECAPKWIRGGIVACYQWAITIGLLLASIVNNFTKDRNDSGSWLIPTCIQFGWAIILASGMFFLPESPRYLIKKGRVEQARASLQRLLTCGPNDPELEQEVADIQANLAQELELSSGSYLDCFRNNSGKNLQRTLTGVFLQAWQQLTGINFIFYYGTTFFEASGIASPFLISIATNVVNVGMTIPGIWGIDKFGRRRLLLVGALGMLICEFIVAIVGVTVTINNSAAQKVLVAFVCIYIAFFAATWGPIAWVVTGEIFPLAIRAKAMSLSTASNWLWNFGIGYATPYLVDKDKVNLGSKVFFIWGSTCVGCLLFTYFFIPETKGLSLEQVDLLYRNSSVIRSNEYRKALLAEDVHAADPKAIKRSISRVYGSAAEEKKAEVEHV